MSAQFVELGVMGTLTDPVVQPGKQVIIDCEDEELSEAQKNLFDLREREYEEFRSKFESFVGKPEIKIETGKVCTFLEFFSCIPSENSSTSTLLSPTPLSAPKPQALVKTIKVLKSKTNSPVKNGRGGNRLPKTTIKTTAVASTGSNLISPSLNRLISVSSSRNVPQLAAGGMMGKSGVEHNAGKVVLKSVVMSPQNVPVNVPVVCNAVTEPQWSLANAPLSIPSQSLVKNQLGSKVPRDDVPPLQATVITINPNQHSGSPLRVGRITLPAKDISLRSLLETTAPWRFSCDDVQPNAASHESTAQTVNLCGTTMTSEPPHAAVAVPSNRKRPSDFISVRGSESTCESSQMPPWKRKKEEAGSNIKDSAKKHDGNPGKSNKPPLTSSSSESTSMPSSQDTFENFDLPTEMEVVENVSGVLKKSFRSLHIFPKPLIRSSSSNPDFLEAKKKLDKYVREMLVYSQENFIQWSTSKGLLRFEHFCDTHLNAKNGNKVKLKLGIYKDNKRFPLPGGYVWFSDCCPKRFYSIYTGSLFEGCSYEPTTLLKLIYHWVCQTSLVNLMRWIPEIKMEYVRSFYCNLRAVCTAAVHEHSQLLGGPGMGVQVAVVRIGSSPSTSSAELMNIICALDCKTSNVFLRAVDPADMPGNEYYDHQYMKKKKRNRFESLISWIDKRSTIFIDDTIDENLLKDLGFMFIKQETVTKSTGEIVFPNDQALNYLKTSCKMFQAGFSLLNIKFIQQFLDELVWRETWGFHPAVAFKSILEHIAEQTRLNTGATLLNRLSKISHNPFKSWKYTKWVENCQNSHQDASQSEFAKGSENASVTNKNSLGSISKKKVNKSAPKADSEKPRKRNEAGVENEGKMQNEAAYDDFWGSKEPVAEAASDPVTYVIPDEEDCASDCEVESSSKSEVVLEHYFYGWLPGQRVNLKISCFIASCCVCRKRFTNCTDLADHLTRHAINRCIVASEEKQLCKLCCKVQSSQSALAQHLQTAHQSAFSYSSITGSTCLICNYKYRDKQSLISHLMGSHCELEMPYICKVCNFRTSIFFKMQEHIESHSQDSFGFCPYCYKTVNFYRNGKPSMKNQFHFIYHVQKHQLNLSKKCPKCSIWFVNKGLLWEHDNNDHNSCSDLPGVKRFCLESSELETKISTPVNVARVRQCRSQPPISGAYTLMETQPVIMSREDMMDSVCIECDSLLHEDHFTGTWKCQMCNYITCCVQAMNEHHSVFHSHSRRPLYKNIPVLLSTNMKCWCSFSSRNGNVMASHLVACKKSQCYLEPESESMQLDP